MKDDNWEEGYIRWPLLWWLVEKRVSCFLMHYFHLTLSLSSPLVVDRSQWGMHQYHKLSCMSLCVKVVSLHILSLQYPSLEHTHIPQAVLKNWVYSFQLCQQKSKVISSISMFFSYILLFQFKMSFTSFFVGVTCESYLVRVTLWELLCESYRVRVSLWELPLITFFNAH